MGLFSYFRRILKIDENDFMEDINERRKAVDVDPLVWSHRLHNAAKLQTDFFCSSELFCQMHDRYGYANSRVRACYYPAARVGEILIRGDAKFNPQTLLAYLWQSDIHGELLSSAYYKECGVAISRTKQFEHWSIILSKKAMAPYLPRSFIPQDYTPLVDLTWADHPTLFAQIEL